ncbi:putative oxidoreductase [Rubellimicrobium mesophilum DSM 19309]|uniref:Putative oxidoreductase n=1 Tax=Rubellimicrobium mesophilum DSM 19309 TaxID=442562 RepID=A0A017HR23_9RHOB|nr:alpha/beta hydrolase [Rubellimicrobium mesophilum]EYD76583.1 putative oxidoreductase [Rubellimicrobium mesophilum DSM 19309]
MLVLDQRHMFDGREVAWGRLGEGPPLVLIHGTPFSSQVWRRIAPLLARRWTVLFFDLLGYGASDMSEGRDVSLGVQNRLLASLFEAWGLTRPDVLCHDFGGATALRAYFLDGLRYGSLTIFDAVALAPWGSPFVAHVRRHEAAFAGLPGYAHEALLRAYIQGAAHHPLTEEALRVYTAPWQGTVGQAAFYRQIAQMDQRYTDEVEGLYRPLDCPVTVLWGEEDAWIPLEKGEELARLIATEPLVRVPVAGHLVQEDAPEAIVAAMLLRCG